MSQQFKSSIRDLVSPVTTSISELTSKADEKEDITIETPVKVGKGQLRGVPLKSVKNYSIQSLFLILNTDQGFEELWIEPREIIQVPEKFISQQMRNLHRRRLIQISN